MSTKAKNGSILWHKRLGHTSDQGLVELKKHQLIEGLTKVETGFCEHCLRGKAPRVKFGRSRNTTNGLFHYIRPIMGSNKASIIKWCKVFSVPN